MLSPFCLCFRSIDLADYDDIYCKFSNLTLYKRCCLSAQDCFDLATTVCRNTHIASCYFPISYNFDYKRIASTAPSCSQFIGWSEHTCGTETKVSEDSSGTRSQNLQHLHASGGKANHLSSLSHHKISLGLYHRY